MQILLLYNFLSTVVVVNMDAYEVLHSSRVFPFSFISQHVAICLVNIHSFPCHALSDVATITVPGSWKATDTSYDGIHISSSQLLSIKQLLGVMNSPPPPDQCHFLKVKSTAVYSGKVASNLSDTTE